MAISTPLGVKRICPSCNARFYDLDRRPASCPKCAHTYDPTVQAKPRRAKRSAAAVASDQDLLMQHMAKSKNAAAKAKKAKEEGEEDFGGVDTAAEEGLGEIEEIDDIEALEELEDIEEPGSEEEDEATLEEEVVGGEVLIDKIDDTEEEEAEEEKAKAPAQKKKKR